MNEPVPVLSILIALGMVAGFVLPGYGWVSWLHRADQLPWPGRLVLGFAWSFAIFSLLGAPFLWYGGSTRGFLLTLGPVWALFALVGTGLYIVYRRSHRPTPAQAIARSKPHKGEPTAAIPSKAWAILAGYALIVALVLILWRFGQDPTRAWIIITLPGLLLVGGLLAWVWRGQLGTLRAFDQDDEAPPPRLWWAVAVTLVVVQAVSVFVYYRPDWDDCYYLAAVLDYEDAPVLNDQEPTHREGFPVSAHQRFMCWELWGAVLCRTSGLNPMVLFHSVLPGFLVLASYAAYSLLLAELLPRRWVPLALIALVAYFFWGISGTLDPANHLLVRVWQGKSVVLHMVLPLIVVSSLRFSQGPSWRWWLSLVACVCCGVGASASAVFMEGPLIACLAAALLLKMPSGRLLFVIGCALSLLPLALAALAIKSALGAEAAVLQDTQAANAPSQWVGHFLSQTREGSAWIIWILCLPLLAVLLGDWRHRAYLIALPALLLLTFANPFLTDVVTARVTSNWGYYRLLWLFPVGVGLAALWALLARLTARSALPQTDARRVYVPLGICGAVVLVWALLPGKYVWSKENFFGGPYMAPRVGQNLEKMPADLLPLIHRLAQEPDLDKVRILCGFEVSSFMTPYSRDFRFVYTRYNYTLHQLRLQGRVQEAIERQYLRGSLTPALKFSDVDWNVLAENLGKQAVEAYRHSGQAPAAQDFPRLLAQYRVEYVITSPLIDRPAMERTRRESIREKLFEQVGYEPLYRGKEYVLWKRRAGFTPADTHREQNG